MTISNNNQLTPKIISVALAAVTLAVFTQSVTDPVNVTKLFLLGGFSFASLGSILNRGAIQQLMKSKVSFSAIVIFLVSSVLVLLMSKSPLDQSIYGVYGRNNGFILYFFLVALFTATLTIREQSSFKYIGYALFISGCANVLYAMWVLAFGDFVGWSNQYGNLLGTLGNPNFIGSFFGMFSGILFAVIFSPTSQWKTRFVFLGILLLTFAAIVDTQAVQGKVLTVAALGIVLFYRVRSSFKSQTWSIAYLALAVFGFILSVLGTLQMGPLSAYLYKVTVSLRGQYWYAGWKTGLENPIFGVGFDSYGDWYRQSRRASALELPGVDTVSNTAHNVYLDIFSFGGFPLLLAYIGITVITIASIIKFTLRNQKFDFTFVVLTTTWACYQLQSVISINQVGLAIWGWVSSAAIIAYTRNHFDNGIKDGKPIKNNSKNQRKSTNQLVSPALVATLACVLGLIIASPPLSADMKWRSAQLSQDVNLVAGTLTPSYMNPQSSYKYTNIVGVLETNGLGDLAHKYALEAVQFNPDSYESWRNLSQISKSTEAERAQALQNMIRLDPLNPNITGPKK